MNEEAKKKRGGARPGSGRTPFFKEGMVQVSVPMPEGAHLALRAEAARVNKSLASLIRDYIPPEFFKNDKAA